MKIAIASDLHLDFAPIELNNDEEADVLILAGDIVEAKNVPANIDFFERCSKQFDKVIYLTGNHEYYGANFYDAKNIIKDHIRHLKNIHMLCNTRIDLGDVVIFGGTMWTDLNKGDPLTTLRVKNLISDFKSIENFTTTTQLFEHNRFLKSLSGFLEWHKGCASEKKIVIVTHHSPSLLSITEKFKDHYHLNGAFHSDLSGIFEDHPEIATWVHGHIHEDVDYNFFNSRIVCNPRGYFGLERIAKNFKLKCIEV